MRPDSLCVVIAIGLLGFLASGILLAASSDQTERAGQSLADVIVTGSRIPTSFLDETMPITVLDERELTRGGFDSFSKVLQTLPMSASSVASTNVNKRSAYGAARADLRALEPKRTLVLLNGHRFPNEAAQTTGTRAGTE